MLKNYINRMDEYGRDLGFDVASMEDLRLLDLTMPIFCLYINLHGVSRQRSEEIINDFLKQHFDYKNVKILVFPVDNQETKFECVWKGAFNNDVDELLKKYNSLDNLGDEILNSDKLTDDDRNKMLRFLRDYKLKSIGIKNK